MKKLSILLISIIALSMTISTYAQAGPDRDGDGVDDSVDRCVSEVGPASNNGCPVESNDNNDNGSSNNDDSTFDANDLDGDGNPNDVDDCPQAGGPESNNGCPLDDTTQTEATAVPLAPLPTTGECVVATSTSTRVNVRSFPSLDAPVIGLLEPEPQTAAYLKFEGVDGESMILTPLGFIAESVLRFGGEDCDELLVMEIPTGTGPFVLRGDIDADGSVDSQYAILPQSSVFPEPFDGTIFLPPTEDDGDDMTPIMHSIMLMDGNGIMAEPGQTCSDLFIVDGDAPVPGCIAHNGDVLVFCIEDYCFSKEDTQQAGILDLDILNSTVFVPTIPATELEPLVALALGESTSEPFSPFERLIFVPPADDSSSGDDAGCADVDIGIGPFSVTGCLQLTIDLIAFCISDVCVYHEIEK